MHLLFKKKAALWVCGHSKQKQQNPFPQFELNATVTRMAEWLRPCGFEPTSWWIHKSFKWMHCNVTLKVNMVLKKKANRFLKLIQMQMQKSKERIYGFDSSQCLLKWMELLGFTSKRINTFTQCLLQVTLQKWVSYLGNLHWCNMYCINVLMINSRTIWWSNKHN